MFRIVRQRVAHSGTSENEHRLTKDLSKDLKIMAGFEKAAARACSIDPVIIDSLNVHSGPYRFWHPGFHSALFLQNANKVELYTLDSLKNTRKNR
jgi:hypothetical protein